MRSVINTTAIVTTSAIVNRTVRTVLAGVDAACALSLRYLRLCAAPAPQHRAHAQQHAAPWQPPFAGKQKPAGAAAMASADAMPGGSDESRCLRRESSRCRRPRASSCLERS
jgi:hypothetical protein